MATVFLSDGLRNTILQAAVKPFRMLIDELKNKLTDHPSVVEYAKSQFFVNNRLQGSYETFIEECRKYKPLCSYPDTIRALIITPSDYSNFSVSFAVPFNVWDRSITIELNFSTAPEVFSEIWDLLEQHRKACQSEENTVNATREILARHKSLNTLVKEWPQVLQLIPKEYEAKLNEKIARNTQPRGELPENISDALAIATFLAQTFQQGEKK